MPLDRSRQVRLGHTRVPRAPRREIKLSDSHRPVWPCVSTSLAQIGQVTAVATGDTDAAEFL